MYAISFTADLEPFPFKRVMQYGKHKFNDPKYTKFKRELGLFALKAMGGFDPFNVPLKIHVDFYKLKPKKITSPSWGDGDNFLKAVMDALQGICYKNDAQVVSGTFTKNCGEPKIVITLEAVENDNR